jgi:asparagine synthase (glutamine-hydrolysing)
VLLNGQGADEVLAGYPNYYRDYASDLVRDGQWGKAFRTLRSYRAAQGNAASPLSRRVLRDVLGRILNIMPGYGALGARNRRRLASADTWLNPDVFSLWNESAPAESSSLNDRLRYCVSPSLNDRLRYSVERESLPLYLRIEDRNSMAHATEVRLPFLDYRLVALAFRLGAEWKLNEGVGKHILRSSMRERIPEVVRARRVKYGFPVPVERWFRHDLYEPMRDLLASREFRESGVWNATLVERELERHRRGEISVGHRLFDVAQFNMWLGLQADWRERRLCSRLPE